jgi:hypothetical protein
MTTEASAAPEITQEIPAGTAPQSPEVTTTEGATAAPAQPAADKPAEKRFTQEELERELGKRLAIQERRRQRELEAEVQRLTAANAPKPTPAAPDDAAPKRDDYDSYEDFIRADARYVAKQEYEAREQAKEKAANEAKVKAERETQVKTFTERLQAAAQKYDDFDEVYQVAAAEEGAELAYFFGKNPDEAARIAQLAPRAQAVEIGKLAARIAVADSSASNPAAAPVATKPAPVSKAPEPAPVSKAPEPIKPVGGTATVEKDPSQMTDREFDAWLDKRMGRKRAGR